MDRFFSTRSPSSSKERYSNQYRSDKSVQCPMMIVQSFLSKVIDRLFSRCLPLNIDLLGWLKVRLHSQSKWHRRYCTIDWDKAILLLATKVDGRARDWIKLLPNIAINGDGQDIEIREETNLALGQGDTHLFQAENKGEHDAWLIALKRTAYSRVGGGKSEHRWCPTNHWFVFRHLWSNTGRDLSIFSRENVSRSFHCPTMLWIPSQIWFHICRSIPVDRRASLSWSLISHLEFPGNNRRSKNSAIDTIVVFPWNWILPYRQRRSVRCWKAIFNRYLNLSFPFIRSMNSSRSALDWNTIRAMNSIVWNS